MIINEITEVITKELTIDRLPIDTIKYQRNDDGSTSINFDGRLLIKIYNAKNKYLLVPKKFLETVYLDDEIEVKSLKSFPDHSRIIINTLELSNSIKHLIKLLVRWSLDGYTGEQFACCSRYVECSNALLCTYPNQLESKGCSYRRNLDKGKVFYGINKNI